MSSLTLQYSEFLSDQDIDTAKLRPNNSYQDLLRQRLGPLHDILTGDEDLGQFLTHRSCPCCSSSDTSYIAEKDRLSLVRCSNCDIIYVNPVFSQEKYFDHYQSKDYQSIVKNLGEDSHEYRLKRFGAERADFIELNHPNSLPKTFLDIGCSTGFTVEALALRGWQSDGLELNPSAAQFASSRNLNVYNKPIEDFTPDIQYSAIGLFDVLEHLLDPKKIMKSIFNLLNPGGNIYIYVPNWNSASMDLLGIDGSHFVWPSHHLTYFNPITLKSFVECCGFEVFYWETQGLDLYDVNENCVFNDKPVLFDNPHLTARLQTYINHSGHGKNLRMFARKPSS